MQILIWGDEMKKQISICIILSIVVILLALLYIKISNDTSPENKQNSSENSTSHTEEDSTNSIISSNEYIAYNYCAKIDNGRVSIYDAKLQTIYMETAIEVRFLSEEIRKELETGIYFKTEEELFDFLESYSS